MTRASRTTSGTSRASPKSSSARTAGSALARGRLRLLRVAGFLGLGRPSGECDGEGENKGFFHGFFEVVRRLSRCLLKKKPCAR